MREAAIVVLARNRVPELGAERDARAEELALLDRRRAHLEPTGPWWERTVFGAGGDAPGLKELEQEIARARAASVAAGEAAEAAATNASAELPPIEIAVRVERLIASTLAERLVGRAPCVAATLIAEELVRIADRVTEIWVVDFDAARFSRALREIAASDSVPQKLDEPRRDEQLGWARIDLAELIGRASVALHESGFAAVRARVEREASEYGAVAEALKQVRARLGPEDWLWPGQSERELRVEALRDTLSREHRELIAASETLLFEIERALMAFPPLGIHVAALAAAGVLNAGLGATELTIVPATGIAVASPSGCPRALLLAALVELRRAVETAFPGLATLVSGRGGARDAAALARAAGGRALSPYRERSADAEPDAEQPLKAHEAHVRLGEAIERGGVRALIASALGHAVLLGGIGRAKERSETELGWFEQLMFWSESAELGGLERLEQRTEWHRSAARWTMDQIAFGIDRAAQELHVFRLRNLILHLRHAIDSIATFDDDVSSATVCPVLHREPALGALSALAGEIGRVWGPRGNKQQLAHEVARHIMYSPATPSPASPGAELRALGHAELVVTVAEALRRSDFATLVDRLGHGHKSLAEAEAAAQSASSQVSLWDWLNFFSQSPAEAARDAWKAHAASLSASVRAEFARADGLLDQALAIYPPAAQYYALGTLQAHVLAIHAVRRSSRGRNSTRYWCELAGKPHALAAFNAWCRAAIHTFGTMEPNGELLEWFVARDLA